MCDETFSQSSWNTLKFNSIYTLNITLTLIQLELIRITFNIINLGIIDKYF